MVPEPSTGTRSARLRPACLGGMLLALLAGCGSTEPGQTLGDRRRAIQDGSAPGIVLIPARTQDSASGTAAAPAPKQAAVPAAPAMPATPAATSATAAAAPPPAPPAPARSAAAETPERKTGAKGFFDSLPPPSGRTMNAAKEMKAADLGIPIPANRPASGPASAK